MKDSLAYLQRKLVGAISVNRVLALTTLAVLVFFYLPIIVLIVISFSTGRVTEWPPTGWTLKWYGAVLNNPRALDAIYTSLLIAVVTAVLTTVLGTLAAYGLARFSMRWKNAIRTLANLPMVVSPLIIGVGLLLYFHAVGLHLGYVSVTLAHMVRAFPFVVLIMAASFLGVKQSLIEAALDLGATRVSAFRRVIFPAILPGIIASALIAFTVSFDEISATFFVIGGGLTTVQTYILEQIEFAVTPEMNALTTIILMLSCLAVTVAFRLQARRETI